jgi:uncharacterized damage-inducible protein DinB
MRKVPVPGVGIQALVTLTLVSLALSAWPAAAADFRTDLVNDLGQLETKLVGLAKAIPADQYSWRPSEGVRTVSQVLMHAAAANYFYPTLMGATLPEGVNPRGLEEITDKDEVVKTLEASIAFLKGHIEGAADDQMTATVNAFGQEMTRAGLLHGALSHNHEHLGQMIAYARSVGVTPPWSSGD